ncbi:MAG TPA: transglutaminase family protein [Verrucomicrobiales bacterium]|nr:transglutaminase family protein [Verrucomicrobiales bacterium]
MPRYHIIHRTAYKYSMPVAISRHSGYLKPRSSSRQAIDSFSIAIEPAPAEQHERKDYFGNTQLHFQIEEPHTGLIITAESRVTVAPPDRLPPPPASAPLTCRDVREALRKDTSTDSLSAAQMACRSSLTAFTDPIDDFAAPFFPGDRSYYECASDLCAAIHQQFEFDPHATDLSTPVTEVLRLRRGVCQDFAHLMLSCLRSQYLPARYVSGYILTLPPPGQSRLQGADASHAWVGIHLPGHGWIDLDPTNNLLCGDGHVTVAIGRDYADISPLRGAVIGGGTQKVKIEVTMTPEEEVSRP